MPTTLPQVTYDEVNQSQVPPITLLGVHGLIAQTTFGQADKPYEVQGLQQYLDTFGPASAASPYFAQIARALSRGVTLWIQRLLATGATQASITLDTSKVTIVAKDFGSWANGTLGVQYTPLAVGAEGIPGTNELAFTYGPNSNLSETWQSTSLAGLIALVNSQSAIVNITTTVGFVEPANTAGHPVFLATGVDGTFVSAATEDTAIAALMPNFDDSTIMPIDTLFVIGNYTLTGYNNVNTYVSARKDIMGLFEIDPTLSPTAAAAFAVTLEAQLSEYMAVYWGSLLTAYAPQLNNVVAGPILADVAAVWAVSDTIQGNVYAAPAGSRRGTIPNVQTFAYNLLSPAKVLLANALVTAGVNIVGSDPTYGPVVWGAQTFYQSGTALDAINVRRSLTSLHEQLMPIYRSELFQPMDPVTWRDAYTKACVVLNAMVSAGAIYAGYVYVGDQESSTIADATYNQPNDLANGLYKVQITVVPVGYVYAINVEVDVNNLTTLFNTTATITN